MRQGLRRGRDHRAGEEAISDTLALRLTDAAEFDLAEIWAYLALEASEATASRFVAAIKAALEPLLIFPLSGAPRDHLAPNLHVKFHGPYAIYYTPKARELIVVRVIHGARDAAAIADRGGFTGDGAP